MKFENEFAADARLGDDPIATREPLGSLYLSEMATAAREYHQARSELTALKAASPGDPEALQGALERFTRARLGVKEAVRF